ncbi:hypothetical protein [Salinimicrobium flavum]|uniref:Uncharacterized protein n=1 Tax=Salinimicrobium flavum TaxID=1737065 RepID=A0ABW5IZR9_9FLAO
MFEILLIFVLFPAFILLLILLINNRKQSRLLKKELKTFRDALKNPGRY